MHRETLRLKAEAIRDSARKMKGGGAGRIREMAEELIALLTDRRKRVTEEVRAEVILLAQNSDLSVQELAVRFELSAPTVRKILKDAPPQ